MKYSHKIMSNYFSRRSEKGAAAIELAFVLILLFMIIGGVIEFGRAFWHYDALAKATRDGARFMSLAAKADINSVEVQQAKILVVDSANAARVSPVLTTANVEVICMNSTFQTIACQDGTAPANIRVAIIDYEATIGGLFPVFISTGGTTTFTRALAPFTVMRYLL